VTEDPSQLLALIASVRLETEPVRRRLDDMREQSVGRKTAWSGWLGEFPVLLIAGGMGKANAAQALAAVLETRRVRGVIGFGVGGAYAGAGLDVGGLALATEEIYGDEGVESPGGWLSTEEIGIPLLTLENGPHFNEIPVSVHATRSASRSLTEAGLPHATGRFVTVSACSGTRARGDTLGARFSAVCETMEGAAYAQVAAIYGAAFVEVRGISNLVEDRDLERWRLADAAAVAADAVVAIVRGWR